MESAKLSVIVPLAATDPFPKHLLSRLAARRGFEVIVSATGSDAADLPEGVTWLAGPAGRGRQLNRGALNATTSWLWFVHADSRLEFNTLDAVERFVQKEKACIGYCDLRFLPDGPKAVALNAFGANWRSRLLGLPYGDQSLCLPADWFHRLGGFRGDLPRGEDLDFIVRARREGLRTRRIGARILTSARRYRRQGWLRTTLAHQRTAWRLVRDARRPIRASDR